jgi:DNA-binding NtrC family response regulator
MSESLELLLIDDEEIVCKRLKPAIEKMGCRVETFQDPKAALERMSEKRFNVIVTDVRMDDIDGIQVLEHSKKVCPDAKVVIITGYAMMALAREAMQKGAYDFISKPFKPNDLREVIARAAGELGFELQMPQAAQE